MGVSGKSGLPTNKRCSALGCESNAKLTPQYRFHRFPSDVDNCYKWVMLSGNSLLLMYTHHQLKTTRALCSKHFTRDQYMVAGNCLSALVRNATPSIFQHPPIPRDKIPSTFLSPANKENKPAPKAPLRIAIPVSHPLVDKPPTLPELKTDLVTSSSVDLLFGPTVPELKTDLVSSSPVDLLFGESSSSSFKLSAHSSHASTPVFPNAVFKRKVLDDLSNSCDSVTKRRCVEAATTTPLPARQPTCRLLFSDDSGLSSSASSASASTSSGSSSRPSAPLRKVTRKSVSTKYRTVLGSYNLSQGDITPKKKAIIDDNKLLLKQVASLKRSLLAVKDNRKALVKLSNAPLVSQLRKKMKTKEGALLMEAQIANHGRKPQGFRFTLSQKTLSLALFKSSRKNYSFLRKILLLPSASILHKLMSRLKFDVGSNVEYFKHLKEIIKNFNPRDRACTVMWDEVHLAKSLNYSEAKDRIIGFEDRGKGSVKNRVADKALVFMVQSLTRKWKQPVAYYFSQGDVPGEILLELAVSVISALQEIGFDVRASVSDQGNNNKLAVRLLRESHNPPKRTKPRLCDTCRKKRIVITKARKSGAQLKNDERFFSKRSCRLCRSFSIRPAQTTHYMVNQRKVYHVWDVPHLLKNLRNNFQTYNVEFDDGKVAKWVHLEKLKEQDGIDGTFYAISLKLTDKHLKACQNSDKMSVALAAQILSHKVATALKMIDVWSDGKAIPGCKDTSDFIYFCDKLFDSFNGSSPRGRGKALRVNLSENSPHWAFWKEAEERIKKWWFVNSKTVFSSHLGWLENISAVKDLWQDLKDDYQFEYLNLRRLNQDPLENLFSVIKSNGAKVPTAVQFIAGLKTSIVTNLRNSGIRGANCEEDGGELLTDMNKLFEEASKKVAEGKSYEETGLTDDVVPDEMSREEELELLQLGVSAVPQDEVNVKSEGEAQVSDIFGALFGDQPQGSDPDSVVCLAEDNESGITVENAHKITEKKKLSRKKKSDAKQDEEKEKQCVKAALQKENKGLFGKRRKMTAFVAGYVVKKVLARILDCDECKECLLSEEIKPEHDLVVAFEYDEKKRLVYASVYVIDTMVCCVDIFLEMMHTSFHLPNLMSTIKERIMRDVDVKSLGCSAHLEEIQRLFVLYFLRVSIYHRCRVLNREYAQHWKNKKTIASLAAKKRSVSVGAPKKRSKKTQKQIEEDLTSIEKQNEEKIDDPGAEEVVLCEEKCVIGLHRRLRSTLKKTLPVLRSKLKMHSMILVKKKQCCVKSPLWLKRECWKEKMWSEIF
ncbi:uncharacterized protein LOC117644050 [Thrips palmi]|uniref:Uncharacterized protein LOC117644050 n=1 Tax=Thrips palmi TaxID=161013 RepID=A0A6P8YY09_THRPL|nr:uncharacterized protein LOC117644050 [Thrips palmi]